MSRDLGLVLDDIVRCCGNVAEYIHGMDFDSFSADGRTFAARGKKPDLFHWRSHGGLEVDLLVQIGAKIVPTEIKLTSTPTLKHLAPLRKFRDLAGRDLVEEGLLVCRVDRERALPHAGRALPLQEFTGWLDQRLGAA